ncbi:hypothetical protein GCM10011316_17640 [Roseibium aquae]|uniref:STAS domain-containing protein n=1 Tax=Roseibium aquae TaxID=1323746 RepID=A0A916THW3_9HYPH|nr:STAS domain-containing protein [Roseibium aquae]GGB45979.1 hypothetical protein GCM10011316_17640 [Roseibium aquae]
MTTETTLLTITDRFEDGIRIICPVGKLETLSAKDFEAHLNGALADGPAHLLVDMGGVDYVTSFGLRSILIVAKKLAPSGHKLVFFGVNASVLEVLRISGFLKIVTVADSEAEALVHSGASKANAT